jgi:hypothetical protein
VSCHSRAVISWWLIVDQCSSPTHTCLYFLMDGSTALLLDACDRTSSQT